MSPFIWALTVKKIRRGTYAALWLDPKYSKGPLVMLEVVRNVLAILLVGGMLRQIFPFWVAVGGTVFFMLIVLVIFRQRLQRFYQRIEERFLTNLNEKETIEESKKQTRLSPWDAHITRYKINPLAAFIGKTLEELQWREQFGINVAFIERGNQILYAPARNERVYPYDMIGVIGTDQQLLEFGKIIEENTETVDITVKENVELEHIVVDEYTRLKGQTIRGSGIREKTNGLVVGIERQGERLLNPSSDTIFEWDDVVWIVGERKKIQQLYII